MLRLHLHAVIMHGAHLIERQILREAEIEDRLDALGAEIIRHLVFGMITRLRIPDLLLLGKFGFTLERIAALRSPMRMNVENFHCAATAP